MMLTQPVAHLRRFTAEQPAPSERYPPRFDSGRRAEGEAWLSVTAEPGRLIVALFHWYQSGHASDTEAAGVLFEASFVSFEQLSSSRRAELAGLLGADGLADLDALYRDPDRLGRRPGSGGGTAAR